MLSPSELFQKLELVRKKRPLVHNITNFVVMNFSANALLALGASPLMAHAEEEMEEIVKLSQSLVLNIGTLDANLVKTMSQAIQFAREYGRRIVLDPVGAGATSYRTQTALRFLNEGIHILRGNASEILALSGKKSESKGVDSLSVSSSALEAAQNLAKQFKITVCVSGETDFITDGKRTASIQNGNPLMSRVTGMGCVASALTGAFAGAIESPFEASVSTMAVMGIAGEIAKIKSEGVGSFQTAFLDALDQFSQKDLERLRGRDESSTKL